MAFYRVCKYCGLEVFSSWGYTRHLDACNAYRQYSLQREETLRQAVLLREHTTLDQLEFCAHEPELWAQEPENEVEAPDDRVNRDDECLRPEDQLALEPWVDARAGWTKPPQAGSRDRNPALNVCDPWWPFQNEEKLWFAATVRPRNDKKWPNARIDAQLEAINDPNFNLNSDSITFRSHRDVWANVDRLGRRITEQWKVSHIYVLGTGVFDRILREGGRRLIVAHGVERQ